MPLHKSRQFLFVGRRVGRFGAAACAFCLAMSGGGLAGSISHLTVFLLIVSFLLLCRLSCRDDADDFVVVFISYCMGHLKQQHTVRQADGLPTAFTAFDPILATDRQRVGEHTYRKFKADTVFAQIGRSLGSIPVALPAHLRHRRRRYANPHGPVHAQRLLLRRARAGRLKRWSKAPQEAHRMAILR